MSTDFDVVVVGSGASGSFAAKTLTERGLKVALIEAGRQVTPEDFANPPKGPVEKGIQLSKRAIATILGQHVQAKVAFYGHQFRHLFVNDRDHPYRTTRKNPYLWIRGKQLGGRLHTYGRVLVRWSDTDFKAGSRDGASPDWPISYADLEPYYERVEDFLGIVGRDEGLTNFPDGKFVKRGYLTALEERLKARVEARWPDRRVTSWRYMPPNAKRVPQPLVAAEATGNLTTFADSIAVRILTDESGACATGVEVLDRVSRKRTRIMGRAVVVAASPVESVRLMLNSASAQHPSGLANSSGTLGRYFMDQVPLVIFGSVKGTKGKEDDPTWEPDPWYGRTGGAYIPRWSNVTERDVGFKRGYGFQGTAGRLYVPDTKNAQFAFMGFGELLPNPENRITLAQKRDKWGVPVPHIRCWMGDNETRLLADERDQIKAMVEEAEFDIEWIGSPLGLEEFGRGAYPDEDPISRLFFRLFFKGALTMGAAIHESGGARMGEDASNSVLDARNRAWDVPNLLVTDASAFVTSGTAGTTLTVMAMTTRACELLADDIEADRL